MSDLTELRALPLDERLKLIEELWDSIDVAEDALPLPDWLVSRSTSASTSSTAARLSVHRGRRFAGVSSARRERDAHRPARGGGRSGGGVPLVRDTRRAGLGHEFFEEVSHAFSRISEQPARYAIVHREARRSF
jgi:putative addiction module component